MEAKVQLLLLSGKKKANSIIGKGNNMNHHFFSKFRYVIFLNMAYCRNVNILSVGEKLINDDEGKTVNSCLTIFCVYKRIVFRIMAIFVRITLYPSKSSQIIYKHSKKTIVEHHYSNRKYQLDLNNYS